MTCGHCQARVENSLKSLKGVNHPKVDKNLVNFEQMKKVVDETEIYKVVNL